MGTHVARPSRSRTPERVRLSSACTTFTDLGFSRSRKGTGVGTGPAWWARSTSAVASTFRCPLDSCGPGRGAGGRGISAAPESPGAQAPACRATHVLNNKCPLFGLVLVHMWVLGKRGTGEYRGSAVRTMQGEGPAVPPTARGGHVCMPPPPRRPLGPPPPVLVISLIPLLSPIWIDNPLGIPRRCLGCNHPPPFPPMQKSRDSPCRGSRRCPHSPVPSTPRCPGTDSECLAASCGPAMSGLRPPLTHSSPLAPCP